MPPSARLRSDGGANLHKLPSNTQTTQCSGGYTQELAYCDLLRARIRWARGFSSSGGDGGRATESGPLRTSVRRAIIGQLGNFCDTLRRQHHIHTKPDASTFTLDPSHLQNDGGFVGVAYDHAENMLTLTTEGGSAIDVDLDMDYPVPPPPPTPIPSSDATLSWVTIVGTAPDQ